MPITMLPFGNGMPAPAPSNPNDTLDPTQGVIGLNPEDAVKRIQGLMPQADYGPYGPNASGETAREYQEQLQSPYMTGLARALAPHHPRVAGMVDNAVLGATAANDAHQRALAANGGIEGAGGGITDALQGLLGPSQMRLAHRQQLEELPLQYAGQEASAQEARARAAQAEASGAQALINPMERLYSMFFRGQGAENTRATTDLAKTGMQDTSREGIAQGNNATAIEVAKIRARGDELRVMASNGRVSASLENTYQRGQQRLAQIRLQLTTHQMLDPLTGMPRAMTPEEQASMENEYNTLSQQMEDTYNQAKLAQKTGNIKPPIYAQDPQGNIHSAPAGTKLPKGWKQVQKP